MQFNVYSTQLDDIQSLSQSLTIIESKIAGRLGVSILNTETVKLWSYNGNQRFPLMSTFKVLACAKMLKDISEGRLNKNASSLIKPENIVSWSPVTKKLINKKISVFNACKATMLTSDNTAANIALEHIGEPKGLTQFLRRIGDNVTRLDRIEPELNNAEIGDPRDTTTPDAMVNTFYRLAYGNILKPEDQNLLRQWMQKNKISGSLLRSVLPEGWKIADRTGAGNNGSRAIVASIWKEGRSPIIVGVYLTETSLSLKERNRVIADVGIEIFERYEIQ